MIESGDFEKDIVGNERLVLGSRVMLCTISMLSTDRIMDCGFTELVPVQTVIVDEASQIEVGDYLPMLARYKTSLRKMVFIGDDKQRECWTVRVGLNCCVLTIRSYSGSLWARRNPGTVERIRVATPHG